MTGLALPPTQNTDPHSKQPHATASEPRRSVFTLTAAQLDDVTDSLDVYLPAAHSD